MQLLLQHHVYKQLGCHAAVYRYLKYRKKGTVGLPYSYCWSVIYTYIHTYIHIHTYMYMLYKTAGSPCNSYLCLLYARSSGGCCVDIRNDPEGG